MADLTQILTGAVGGLSEIAGGVKDIGAQVLSPALAGTLLGVGRGFQSLHGQRVLNQGLQSVAQEFESIGSTDIAEQIRRDPKGFLAVASTFGGVGEFYKHVAKTRTDLAIEKSRAASTLATSKGVGFDTVFHERTGFEPSKLTTEGRARALALYESDPTSSGTALMIAGGVPADEIAHLDNFSEYLEREGIDNPQQMTGVREARNFFHGASKAEKMSPEFRIAIGEVLKDPLTPLEVVAGPDGKPIKVTRAQANRILQAGGGGAGLAVPKEPEKFDTIQNSIFKDPILAPFRVSLQEFNLFEGLMENEPSGQNDIAMIFAYMRALDPGSVVREGEFKLSQNALDAITRLDLNLQRALPGGKTLGTWLQSMVGKKQSDIMQTEEWNILNQASATVRLLGQGQDQQMLETLAFRLNGGLPGVRDSSERFRKRIRGSDHNPEYFQLIDEESLNAFETRFGEISEAQRQRQKAILDAARAESGDLSPEEILGDEKF
jgi:hypothetical protein